jgi:hypothetical protein
MKNMESRGSMQLRTFITLLFLPIALIGFTNKMNAQGWIFTATPKVTGPCSGYEPPLPTFTITYMPTQGQCESLRQTLIAVRSDIPMYNNGAYIGTCSAFFTATACTGSDISTSSGQTGLAGSVSIDGLTQGTAFFSPHESRGLENWIDDYVVKLQSMGISTDQDNSPIEQNIPLTGDANFDKGYIDRIKGFEKPEHGGVVDLSGKTGVVDLNSAAVNPGPTVPLLNTPEAAIKSVAPSYVPALETIVDNKIAEDGHPVIESLQNVSKMVVDIYAPGWVGLGLKGGINLLAEDAKAVQDIYDGKACPSTSTILANALKTTVEDGVGDAVGNKALSVSKYIGIKSGIKPINIANAVKTVEWGKVATDGAENGYNLGKEILN